MGRRGPPSKPMHLKVLSGNPGKRPIKESKPRASTQGPRCPSSLSPAAKKVWKRVVPELKRLGLLSAIDTDALVAYCRTYARWEAAEDFLDKRGEVYAIRDEKGQVKCMQQFPQVSISRNLLQVLKSYQMEFGMTPAAWARVADVALSGSGNRARNPWGLESSEDGKDKVLVTDRLGNPITTFHS